MPSASGRRGARADRPRGSCLRRARRGPRRRQDRRHGGPDPGASVHPRVRFARVSPCPTGTGGAGRRAGTGHVAPRPGPRAMARGRTVGLPASPPRPRVCHRRASRPCVRPEGARGPGARGPSRSRRLRHCRRPPRSRRSRRFDRRASKRLPLAMFLICSSFCSRMRAPRRETEGDLETEVWFGRPAWVWYRRGRASGRAVSPNGSSPDLYARVAGTRRSRDGKARGRSEASGGLAGCETDASLIQTPWMWLGCNCGKPHRLG